MPFTIHLDPYLRKVIKEERANFLAMQSGTAPAANSAPEAKGAAGNLSRDALHSGAIQTGWSNQPWTTITLPTPDHHSKTSVYPPMVPMVPTITHCDYGGMLPTSSYLPLSNQVFFKPSLPSRFADKPLSSLTAEDISEMLRHLDGVRTSQVYRFLSQS